MTAKILKKCIISLLLVNALPAFACAWIAPERWYMYSFDSPEFGDYFRNENSKYWSAYCKSENPQYWFTISQMKEAAGKKNDAAMTEYLNALEKYMNVAEELSFDRWSYPTAEQLAHDRITLQDILSECRRHKAGRLADRWLLLEMRANMTSGAYAENVALWESRGVKAAEGYVKEMMRNVYANALLNTGKKVDAWNIYAKQNDNKSLLWSARKYTNLAGIKELYRMYPGAPVHKYLLERYVNTVQDVVDMYYDDLHQKIQNAEDSAYGTDLNKAYSYYWEDISGKAYARIDKDYMKEIREFIAFSDSVAKVDATVNPCMWETASALCSYFLNDFQTAKKKIDCAMTMSGDSETKTMARSIRMLIATSSEEISSTAFKTFMTLELTWLDREIEKSKSNSLMNARDRILNLGLARNYEGRGNSELARLMAFCRDYMRAGSCYVTTAMIQNLYPNSSGDIAKFFVTIDNPGNDPLARYVASHVVLTDDFKNDILGTKYLQEGKWEEALPYLKRVSMNYLNNQPIAFYAARRNYKIPAWNGFQTVGDNNYEETQKPVSLKSNVKADFCNYMLQLAEEAKTASASRKERIMFEEATALYQASRFGQCWYIAQYGFSQHETLPVTADELAGKAIARLRQCEKSGDANVRASALFALVYTAPDEWITEEWDWENGRTKITVNRNSDQFVTLNKLNSLLRSTPEVQLPEISRCDVLKQWRKFK